jgi:hypothetical protein
MVQLKCDNVNESVALATGMLESHTAVQGLSAYLGEWAAQVNLQRPGYQLECLRGRLSH